MKANPISLEEYLRNKNFKKLSKTNRTQTDDKLNELIDHFTQLKKQENLNDRETEEKDAVPRTIQTPKHMNAEHTKAIR